MRIILLLPPGDRMRPQAALPNRQANTRLFSVCNIA